MADPDPEPENPPAPSSPQPSRRKTMTPEQRKFLATPSGSPPRDREETPEPYRSPPRPVAPPIEKAPAEASSVAVEGSSPPEAALPPTGERRRGVQLPGETKASRRIEMQHALVVIGLLIFLAAIFYAGRQFDRAKGFIMSRINPPELEGGPAKFPDLTSEELVEAALAAEREGDWAGAVQRLLEAKRKDLGHQGILFHIGKGNYDRRDWDGADSALAQALKFGENVAVANQLRGLIAVRRRDLTAAERFFEAAATAEPFIADFFYLWGDALRLNQHPREAVRRYQQGVQRSRSEGDAALCRFKIRLARIEGAEASAIAAELDEMRKAGPLSLDWLMTDAALQLHAGKIEEAAQLISKAHSADRSNVFVAFAGDAFFLKASETHPEIAAVGIAPKAK